MITTTAKSIAAAFAMAAALGATTAQAASVTSGDDVRVTGSCSNASTSKLKVKRDHGRLQVEFEVDQNRNAVPWTVELRKDGKLVFQGRRVTAAPSGSFRLERRVAGTRGVIKARATRNGETCTATTTAKISTPQLVATTGNPAVTAASDDGAGHDAGDDNGSHLADPAAHDTNDDGGRHGSDD